MDARRRAVPVPAPEVAVDRAARRQILRPGRPLAARARSLLHHQLGRDPHEQASWALRPELEVVDKSLLMLLVDVGRSCYCSQIARWYGLQLSGALGSGEQPQRNIP